MILSQSNGKMKAENKTLEVLFVKYYKNRVLRKDS
jgi:hypothetical protein